MRFFFVFPVLLIFFLYSCSQGIKGSYFSTLEIGTNQDQFSIWIPYEGSNYLFPSFKDALAAKLKVGPIDDIFYFPFAFNSKDVFVINQLPERLKIFQFSRSTKAWFVVPFNQPTVIVDSIANSEGNLMLLSFNAELPTGDCLYSLYFLKKETNKLEIPGIVLTNVVKLDVDEQDNFYIFQVINEKLRIEIFTSSFIRVPSVEIDPASLGFTNLVFSSAVVIKPFHFLLKFDSKDNFQKSIIFGYNYNEKKLVKRYEILLPRENFVMLSMMRNGFVACASYKNNFPVVMGFNPFESLFRFSYEIYIDFQYPIMMRGFKISRDGKLIVPFVDLPDDRIVFYYWDLISTK